MSRFMDYGGKAMTAYNLGKAAYATGRFLLPLVLYRRKEMLHSVRETGRRVQHRVQQVANAAAAAGMVTAAAGGLAAARGLYEKARPHIAHSKPGLARGVDTALSAFDSIRAPPK